MIVVRSRRALKTRTRPTAHRFCTGARRYKLVRKGAVPFYRRISTRRRRERGGARVQPPPQAAVGARTLRERGGAVGVGALRRGADRRRAAHVVLQRHRAAAFCVLGRVRHRMRVVERPVGGAGATKKSERGRSVAAKRQRALHSAGRNAGRGCVSRPTKTIGGRRGGCLRLT